jgi:hypothetical protein
MGKEPRAYALAEARRAELIRKYNALLSSLSGDGVATRLRTFESLLAGGSPAINMTLPGCIRFLETGKWLNVYEVVALKVGKRDGPEFVREVRKKLGEWHLPRMEFERLLKFRKDTHYAALNLGGTGPDYGECCVRFGPTAPLRYSTIFAGDPLRVIYDDQGNQVLSDEEILGRFSVYELRVALAAITNPIYLARQRVIDRQGLMRMLDDRETLIEVHLHGAVRRDHATEIAIQPDFFMSLGRRCLEYEDAPTHARAAKKYSRVRALKRLLQLTDSYGLRLRGDGQP